MRGLRVLPLAALLAACAPMPPTPPLGADLEAAWRARRSDLADLSHWTATGRILIRTEDEAWSATLQWVQQGESYRIRLIGPLGQGTVQVSGDARGVTLRTSDGIHRAASPRALMSDTLGWWVPVGGLRYWMTGLDDPQGPAAVVSRLDPFGRPESLDQAGWAIEFQRYASDQPLALPTKLSLQGERLSVRVVVKRWEYQQ